VGALIQFIALATAFFSQTTQTPPPGPFHLFSYQSQVLGGERSYRVLLPAGYVNSGQRYPVIYWLRTEEREPASRENRLAAYVASHELILVDAGPSDPRGQFTTHFPELVAQIDATLLTVADRGHRAVAGVAGGGFMAFYLAGKYPDLVSAASSFEGTTEADVGPEHFPVECNLDDLFNNYDGVRARLTRSSADSLAFYHRRLNSIWAYTRPSFENIAFLAGEDLAEMDRTLDFHMAAFALPLAEPAVFSHADAWPNFTVWGWEAVSDRKQPGYTLIEDVSNTGFRSSVREYLPGGATIPEVHLSIGSPPIYPPGVALTVTYIRLLDSQVRRTQQRADSRGRLTFDLSGDAYEVAVSTGPLLAVSGYDIADASWATAGQPVNLKVRFWNKGGAPVGTSLVRWESPNPGVKFATAQGRLYALAPGESAMLPVTFTVDDRDRAIVKIFAVSGTSRLPIEVPLFPPAEAARDFQIADGRTVTVYRHATQKVSERFGEGSGDGHAAPGETFAVLLPEGGALRAAELFSNDACVDNVLRGSDSWTEYDHSGASAKYSLPSIHLDCAPGHAIHMLARIVIPNGPETQVKYYTLEFPVWYRNEGK
jgi:pimeloyl-ACP methyl ester carboxylesterase